MLVFFACSAISAVPVFVVVGIIEHLTFADQHQREVGQRREIAAGAD